MFECLIECRILVKTVCRVGDVRATFRRRFAITDVIEVIAVAVGRVDCGGRVRELAARVVEIGVDIGRVEAHTATDIIHSIILNIPNIRTFSRKAQGTGPGLSVFDTSVLHVY